MSLKENALGNALSWDLAPVEPPGMSRGGLGSFAGPCTPLIPQTPGAAEVSLWTCPAVSDPMGPPSVLSLAPIEIGVLFGDLYPAQNRIDFSRKMCHKSHFFPLFPKFPLLIISLDTTIMNVTEVTMGKWSKWNVTENADF